MGRSLGPKCKKCRREGEKLFLKGERCFGVKCSMIKRAYAPGQHGQRKKFRTSEYGVQLRGKQKIKRSYGILERQFRKYYETANRMKGNTASLLSSLLERRLDNVVHRLGFAISRNQARQFVNHGHFLVNGKVINIPSYLVEEGDVISIKNGKLSCFQDIKKTLKDRQVSPWLSLEHEKLQGKVVSLPTKQETDVDADIYLVVEYYSKT